MSWKDILVFANGAPDGLARVRMAADLALAHDAHLEVCIPTAIPAPFASGGVAMAVEVMDRLSQGAQEDAAQVIERVRLSLPELGRRLQVETPELPLADLPRLAGRLARKSDVVMVGQPISEDGSHDDDAILQGALMMSGRPCLMMPRWPEPQSWGRRILVAWKGAPQAARAVHEAMPLLLRADQAKIISVGGAEQEGEGPLGLARLTAHLRHHGVGMEPAQILPAASPGPAILAEAQSWNADLIVMGGYGHSPFRERALGGATRTVVRMSPVPVLMSH